jgi:hypothetical protein
MSDDLPISDVADQLHDDLLVKRLTDSDNTGFSNDLEKGASVDEVAKTASRRVLYSLVRREDDSEMDARFIATVGGGFALILCASFAFPRLIRK